MVSNPRSTISDRTSFEFALEDRKKRKPQRSKPLMGRVVSTLVALVLLAVVFRYLPPESGNAETRSTNASVRVMPSELSVGRLQVNEASTGEAVYLDGMITNAGKIPVSGATAEVSFRDAQGNLVGVMQRPIAAAAQSDQNDSRFATSPIKPNEVRPFRVAVEQVPPDWNHQTPELRVVAVSVQ